jgi:hypothetical protein
MSDSDTRDQKAYGVGAMPRPAARHAAHRPASPAPLRRGRRPPARRRKAGPSAPSTPSTP